MKKIIAVLLLFALALTMAACGTKTPAQVTTEPETETTTDPAATQPEVGRIGEKAAYYVYIPEDWCKMEYKGNDFRLRLFNIPSAPKIEEGKTAEIEIVAESANGTKEDVDAAVAELLKIEGAKKGKPTELDGETFQVVTYTEPTEKRVYTAYVGLGAGRLSTITLKGIAPTDENAAAILGSISFKAKVSITTTTTKAVTTTKATTKADEAGKTTVKAEVKTTKAAATTTKAAATTTKKAETTTKK